MCSDSQSDEQEQAEDMFEHTTENLEPKLFPQIKLNYLVRNLGLTKEQAELLAFKLKENNFWAEGTNIYVYRRREQQSYQ